MNRLQRLTDALWRKADFVELGSPEWSELIGRIAAANLRWRWKLEESERRWPPDGG